MKLFKMNKRGDDILMKNALEVILAVLGIGLVIFAAYLIYNAFVSDEYKSAQNTLNNIAGKIDNLKEGQTGNFIIQGFNVKDKDKWYLVGWSKGSTKRPDKCYFNSCICICKLDVWEDFENNIVSSVYSKLNDNGIKKCQENGFCKKLDVDSIRVWRESNTDKPGYFSHPLSRPLIEAVTGIPSSRTDEYIIIPRNFVEIKVMYSQNDATKKYHIEIYNKNPNNLVYTSSLSTVGKGIFADSGTT